MILLTEEIYDFHYRLKGWWNGNEMNLRIELNLKIIPMRVKSYRVIMIKFKLIF